MLASKFVYNFPSNLTFTYFTVQFFRVVDLHVPAMFVSMPFSKEDPILNEDLYLLEEYTAQQLLKKIPGKNRNERVLRRMLI